MIEGYANFKLNMLLEAQLELFACKQVIKSKRSNLVLSNGAHNNFDRKKYERFGDENKSPIEKIREFVSSIHNYSAIAFKNYSYVLRSIASGIDYLHYLEG